MPKSYLLPFLAILLFSCSQVNQSEASSPPNILIFFTDDQGYADLGCYGAVGFETPHLDQLAQEGIRFTDFYVPATVCTPSRAGLLTGRYPKRSNMHEAVLFPFSDGGLALEEFTLAEMLKEQGYATACIGKWHLGHQARYMPNQQGFDYFFGVPYSNDMDSYYYQHNDFQSPPLPLYRNEELIEEGPEQALLTRRYTEETVKLIKEKRDQPFFIYLAHNMPHLPFHASEAFAGKSEKGLYGDVIMELDWSMGEIVKGLKDAGVYENTLIIFTSDNGPRVGSAAPLRGKKAETWEGGQRVPAIMCWPNTLPAAKVSHQMLSTLDLFPTLATVNGFIPPESLNLDGMNLLPHLRDPDNTRLPERPFLYYARNGQVEAMRLGKWKLHLKKSGGWDEKTEGPFPLSLYDLEANPGETHNLAEEHPRRVESMKKQLMTLDEGI